MTTKGWVGAYARLISQSQAEPYESTSEEEDEEDDDDAEYAVEEDIVSEKKKRNMAEYRDLGWTTWHHGDKEYYYTDEEVDDALWALADQEFGGKKANGVFWVYGPKRFTKLKEVRVYRCAFYNCCNCGAQIQKIYWKNENRWSIQVASLAKHSHNEKKTSRGVLKEALVTCVTSPSKLKVRPKVLLGQAMLKTGVKLTQEQQRSLKRAVGRRRVTHLTKDLLNGGDGSRYLSECRSIHRSISMPCA